MAFTPSQFYASRLDCIPSLCPPQRRDGVCDWYVIVKSWRIGCPLHHLGQPHLVSYNYLSSARPFSRAYAQEPHLTSPSPHLGIRP